jgi:hypothetical protein
MHKEIFATGIIIILFATGLSYYGINYEYAEGKEMFVDVWVFIIGIIFVVVGIKKKNTGFWRSN